ncbi:MAG: outer membrane beta-barrel family protein [Agriterribacter sp.]
MKNTTIFSCRFFLALGIIMLPISFLAAQDTPANRKTDTLQEIIVKGKKQLIEISKGKIVLNLQNSTLTSGVSVFDALKKLPGISIGQDDNILLRGTSNINVMIDGKMTYLSGKQLATLLQGMSAEDLSKIELLTAPSAEFDADGNAGIINIVTKKRNALGYAIDLRSGISRGRYWMVNENITASLNTKKWNLYGSLDYNTPHRVITGKSGNTVVQNDERTLIDRTTENIFKVKYYTYRIGTDWQAGRRHLLSLHYNGYFDDFKAAKFSSLKIDRPNGAMYSDIQTQNNITEPYHYDAANFSYKFDIDTSGKKITTDAHYISYRNLSDGLMTSSTSNGGGNPSRINTLRQHQPGFITIKSIKTDIDLPYKSISLKAGVKYAITSNDNAYRFDSLVAGNFVKAETMSNHFRYEEKIFAAYASALQKFNKTTVEAGLRLEDTHAKGFTVKQDLNNTWKYTRLFPSLSIDHLINNNNKINISVSRRINRPSYADLNPVRWYNDQYFYYSGNPELQPEMAWLFSAAYALRSKYILTATYGLRDNYIGRQLVIDPSNGSIKSQSANFNNAKRFDLDVSAPVNITSYWSLQLSTGLNYTTYPISITTGLQQLSQWAVSVQLQQQVQLPYDIQLQVSGFFYSPELMGIYQTATVFFMDAGIRKSFLKNNLVLQLTGSDLFRTNRYKAMSQTDITDYHYHDRPDSKRIAFSIRYHIGGKLLNKKGSAIEEQERL